LSGKKSPTLNRHSRKLLCPAGSSSVWVPLVPQLPRPPWDLTRSSAGLLLGVTGLEPGCHFAASPGDDARIVDASSQRDVERETWKCEGADNSPDEARLGLANKRRESCGG